MYCRPVVLAKHAARRPGCSVVPASFSTTTWLRSCRDSVKLIPVSAVIPWCSSPLPRYYRRVCPRYRHYRGKIFQFVPTTAVLPRITAVLPMSPLPCSSYCKACRQEVRSVMSDDGWDGFNAMSVISVLLMTNVKGASDHGGASQLVAWSTHHTLKSPKIM